MTIIDQLTAQVALRPEASALIDVRAGISFTFRELHEQVQRAAAWWQERGIERGKSVLMFAPMSARLYVALLALFRIGAVAVFLDPSAGRQHIERCCERWKPDALFATAKAHLLRLYSGAIRRIPLKVSADLWIPGACQWPAKHERGTCDTAEAEPNDPALVTFTSGSTGVPKTAVRTHAFLLAQHRALAPSISLEPGEIDLATLPIFVLANLASGVTTVIPDLDLRRPGAIDAARTFEQVERFQVSRITASPALFERLIAHSRAHKLPLPSLRKLFTGGAPVFLRVLEGMQEMAPNAAVTAVYGSTEAEPIAHIEKREFTPEDLISMRSGCGLLAGAWVPEIQLRVLRDRWGEPRGQLCEAELNAETMPRSEPGEIVVSGEHVLRGYLGGIGDEETKFRVENATWHRTGDAGWIDAHGRLWLLGRCAARIRDNRGELYPFAVECIAMTFDAVRRAAVLAHEGKRLLIVEADSDPHLAYELHAAVASAQIDEVLFIDHMPLDKRHNAKIDYVALRAWLEGRR